MADDIYMDMRDLALNVTAAELGVKTTGAFGVVIDIAAEGGSATFTAYRTGDASMYTSSGGGIIGGIQHESLREAAIALVGASTAHIPGLEPAVNTSLPPIDGVSFYVLTAQGTLVASDSAENFFAAAGRFADLFAAANMLLTELRLIDEQRAGEE